MKIARNMFKCLVFVNLVVYAIFFAIMVIFAPSRDTFHRLVAVLSAAWLLLLAVSFVFLFFDRRAAGRGFLVLIIGILVAMLFPEL